MIMTASEFVKRIKEIEHDYKTVYMKGTIGQKCTNALIDSQATRKDIGSWYNTEKINQLRPYANSAWAFDCVGLIKAVLWGWTESYAPYCKNAVPDINETTMINQYCNHVSSDFSTIIAGEVVWLSGHIGVYIGNGEVIECTPKWKNCVQISWLQNLGTNPKYNNRSWVKHGRLNWLEYPSSKPRLTASSRQIHTVSKDYLPNITRQFSVSVTADELNVRSHADVSSNRIIQYPKLTKGNSVDVCDSLLDYNNDTWYFVRIAGKHFGYIHSDWTKVL